MTEERQGFIGNAPERASENASRARKLRESRDPAYLAMLDAALARAKGQEPPKHRSSQWKAH